MIYSLLLFMASVYWREVRFTAGQSVNTASGETIQAEMSWEDPCVLVSSNKMSKKTQRLSAGRETSFLSTRMSGNYLSLCWRISISDRKWPNIGSFEDVDSFSIILNRNTLDAKSVYEAPATTEWVSRAKRAFRKLYDHITDEFKINTTTDSDQNGPFPLFFDDDTLIILWFSDHSEGERILGQEYDKDFNIVGVEFEVSNTAFDRDFNVIAAILTNGSYVVSWKTTDNSISARIFKKNIAQGPEFLVKSGSHYLYIPSILGLNDGGFAITWGSVNSDIHVKVYDSQGNVVISEFEPTTNALNTQNSSRLAQLPNGNIVLVWHADTDSYNVYGKIFDTQWNIVLDEFIVNTFRTNDQFGGEIGVLKNGGFAVLYGSNYIDTSNLDVFAQAFDSSGNKIGDELHVNQDTDSFQSPKSIIGLYDGSFLITYDDFYGYDGSGIGVFARRYNQNATPAGDVFQISQSYLDDQQNVKPAATKCGFIVTWESKNINFDIFARVYYDIISTIRLNNSIQDQSAYNFQLFSFVVPVSTFHTTTDDQVTYSARVFVDGTEVSMGSFWLSLDSSSRTFSGTPTQEQTFLVQLEAFEGCEYAVDEFQFTVAPNFKPVANVLIPNQVVPFTIEEIWEYYVPTNAFKDFEGDPISYTGAMTVINGEEKDLNIVWETLKFDTVNGKLYGIPNLSGEFIIRIYADDGLGDLNPTPVDMTVEILSQGIEPLELYRIDQRGFKGFISSDDSFIWISDGPDLKRFDIASKNPSLVNGPSLQYSLSSSIIALAQLSQSRIATGDDRGNITLLSSSENSQMSSRSVNEQITDIYNDDDLFIYVSHGHSVSKFQFNTGTLELSSSITLDKPVTSLAKTGDIIYAGTQDGLFLIDSLTNDFRHLGISDLGYVYDLQIFQTYLYILKENQLTIFDASDPNGINFVNTRSLEELGTDILVTKIDNDVIVFITEGDNGVSLINASNPLNLSSEGYYSSISTVNSAYVASTGRWGIALKESEVYTIEIFRRNIQLQVCDTGTDPCSNELETQALKDFSKDLIVTEFLPTFKTDFIYSLSYSYTVLQVTGANYQSAPQWLSSSKVDNKLFRLSGQVPEYLIGSVLDLEVQAFAFKSDGEKLLTLRKVISLSIIPKHATFVSSIADQSLQVGEEWIFSFSDSVFSHGDQLESEYLIDSVWVSSNDVSFIRFTPSYRQWYISSLDSTKENFFNCDPCDSFEYSTTYVFKVTAKNSASETDPGVSTTFNLYIYSGRIPDQQTHPGISKTIILDESIFPSGIEYTVSLLDSDGNSQNLPWWMSYISNERKILMFPSATEIDEDFDIQISGNNNGVELTSTFQIQVRNEAPVAIQGLENQRVKLGESLDYTFSSGTFSDSDGDALSYTVQWKKEDGTLTTAIPSWITFSESTLTFYGSPSVQESYSLIVYASDGLGGEASTEFVIEAYNNTPFPNPESSLESQIYHHIGLFFSLALSSELFTDPDGDTLSYSALQSDGSELPTWLTFNPSSLLFSGTPSAARLVSTSLIVQIQASDGYSSSSSSFTIYITNSSPQSSSLEDQTVHIGELFSLSLSSSFFSDADGDPLTYTVVLQDESPLPSWLVFNSLTLSFSGTPATSDLENTSLNIKMSASDGYSTTETSFSLSITNSAPQAGTIDDQSVHIGTLFSYTLSSDLFTDDDGDSLEYTARQDDGSLLPIWLAFNPFSLQFSGTPVSSELENTSLNITVSVSDGYSSAEAAFTISVTNTAPEAGNIEDQSVHIGTLYSYALPSDLFTDEDGDSLEYTVSQADGSTLPSWLSFSSNIYQFIGAPTSSLLENTTVNITISVSDGYSSAETSFSLSITNAPPIISSRLDIQIGLSLAQRLMKFKPGVEFDYILSENTFIDSDNDILTFSSRLSTGDPLPEWLSFDPNTQQFYGTPIRAEILSISVTASDGYASVTDVFQMEIINKTPIVNKSLQRQFDHIYQHPFAEGHSFSFQFAEDTFTDEDDSLTYSASFKEDQGEWRSLDFSWVELEGRTLSGTVAIASTSNSTLTIRISATDGFEFVSDSFDFTILSPFPSASSGKIHIESEKDSMEVEVLTNGPKIAVFSYGTLSILDVSNDQKTDWKIEGSPSDINYVLERVKYRPSSDRLLSELCIVLKIDGQEQEYPLSVFTPQESITSFPIPDQIAYIDDSFNLRLKKYFEYSDESQLTYSLVIEKAPEGNKDWLNFESTELSGIPTDAQEIGTYKLLVTAEDEFGESESEEIYLEVDYTQLQKYINIVTTIARFIGPAITIIGLFTYRANIYNRFMKKRKIHAPLLLNNTGSNIREFLVLRPDEEDMAFKIFKRLPDKSNYDEDNLISDIESIIRELNKKKAKDIGKVKTVVYEESASASESLFEQVLKYEDLAIVKIKGSKYHARFIFFCVIDYIHKQSMNKVKQKELDDLVASFKKDRMKIYTETLLSQYSSLSASFWIECKDSWTVDMPDLTKSLDSSCNEISEFLEHSESNIYPDIFLNRIRLEQWKDRAVRIKGKTYMKKLSLYQENELFCKINIEKHIEEWIHRNWLLVRISENKLTVQIDISKIRISEKLFVCMVDKQNYLVFSMMILPTLKLFNSSFVEENSISEEGALFNNRQA